MRMRRLCSCMMALLLAVSLPLTVFAETYDLENGSIIVSSNESGQYVTQKDHGIINAQQTTPTVITQSNSSDTSTSNTVAIDADTGSTANVTLSGVNIDASGDSGKAAVEITGSGDVTIELDGTNTVQSGKNRAGVEKDNNGSLTITDNHDAQGSLTATGGKSGAGIGGGKGGDGSNITISGGTVNATGGENAAGIGGGEKNDGFDGGNGSNITISGGTVTANGGISGAGIGGADGGNGSGIAIRDGNVTANGGEGGSGIGGGAYGDGSGITISGGTVDANGGTDAAGIGGGERRNGSNITISGGTVDATGGDAPSYENGDKIEKGEGGGAGIGGGAYGSGDNIVIKFNAQVTAEGKGNAANIGNGNSEKDTEKQKDNVDLSGLSSFGKVNGVSGSDGVCPGAGVSYGTGSDAVSGLGGLAVFDDHGNDLSSDIKRREDTLQITAMRDNVLVSGTKIDVDALKGKGIHQINLETNRVNVRVSNDVLDKITGTGGSFQLRADDTTVCLTTTGEDNRTKLDLKLTANDPSGAQAAPSQSSKKPEISMDSQSNTGNNSEGSTLQLKTDATDATLTYSQKCAETLLDSQFRNLALAVGNVLATVDSLLAANTTENGSGSISIGGKTVMMNGFTFSAGDSSENDKLTDLVNNIKFKEENPSQGGSTMVAEVDAKGALKSASLKVTGSALQSLIEQDIEETALSVNGKTTGFNNSAVRKQFDDSQMGSTAVISVKQLENGEIETWADKVDEDGNVTALAGSL